MPQTDVDGLSMNCDVQGEGEPLVLIPYLAADLACYAFQLPGVRRAIQLVTVQVVSASAWARQACVLVEGGFDPVSCSYSSWQSTVISSIRLSSSLLLVPVAGIGHEHLGPLVDPGEIEIP